MPIKARCPSCGKLSQFSDSDAGLVTLCTACGARFYVSPEGAGAADTNFPFGVTAGGAPVAPPPPAARDAITPPSSSDSTITPEALAALGVPAESAAWGLSDTAQPGAEVS